MRTPPGGERTSPVERARDPLARVSGAVDEHREDPPEAPAGEVMALIRIEEHAAARKRNRELQRVLVGHSEWPTRSNGGSWRASDRP